MKIWKPRESLPEQRSEISPPPQHSPKPDHGWSLLALPMILFFGLPVLVLVLRTSPGQLLAGLQQQQVLLAIGVSLRTTAVSLVVIVLFGTPLGYWMGKTNFRFKRFVDTLIDLPTILPPSVAGVALLITFGRRSLLGGGLEILGIQVAFTPLAVIMAQVFIAAPFYVRSAVLGFSAFDREIEQAAQLDGANRWQIFRYMDLPLARIALLTGCMMSWARALGEFGATIIFAGNLPGRTQTMPVAIYLGFEVDLGIALTLSVILVAISFTAMLLVKLLIGRDSE
jgi:molybdate transport system permease protein